ncbi:GH23484 [Drosophila grimshawi]|uniref:GH23484 n=1 Tax=Drosophila grimshawi TaxID=7222 RepID=B4K3U5_DROGR|nr:GH23484 [Drosophila grimshawi]
MARYLQRQLLQHQQQPHQQQYQPSDQQQQHQPTHPPHNVGGGWKHIGAPAPKAHNDFTAGGVAPATNAYPNYQQQQQPQQQYPQQQQQHQQHQQYQQQVQVWLYGFIVWLCLALAPMQQKLLLLLSLLST